MNRQSRTLVVLLVALGAAAIASFGVYRAISSIPERRVEIATKHAVVAARSLPMGARLTADNVKVVGWPERTPLAGGFSSIEDVVDRGLISAVVENEPISESKLAPKEAGAGLPPSIPAGMRAMSVRVNEVIGVAGFVVPGTHVDVMAVLKGQKSDGLARVVVSNVQVLTAAPMRPGKRSERRETDSVERRHADGVAQRHRTDRIGPGGGAADASRCGIRSIPSRRHRLVLEQPRCFRPTHRRVRRLTRFERAGHGLGRSPNRRPRRLRERRLIPSKPFAQRRKPKKSSRKRTCRSRCITLNSRKPWQFRISALTGVRKDFT
jgi:hypothetical protein